MGFFEAKNGEIMGQVLGLEVASHELAQTHYVRSPNSLAF
jgi:hypothetical protein